MSEAKAGRHQLIAILLLCLCGLLATADFVALGIAVAFGADGFGGDGAVSSARAARQHSGILAGSIGLVVAVFAGIAFLAFAQHGRRNHVLTCLVGAQGVALTWLLVSTW